MAKLKAKNVQVQDGKVKLLTSPDRNGTNWYGPVTKVGTRVRNSAIFVDPQDVEGYLKLWESGKQIFVLGENAPELPVVENPVTIEDNKTKTDEELAPPEDPLDSESLVPTEDVPTDVPVKVSKRGKQ